MIKRLLLIGGVVFLVGILLFGVIWIFFRGRGDATLPAPPEVNVTGGARSSLPGEGTGSAANRLQAEGPLVANTPDIIQETTGSSSTTGTTTTVTSRDATGSSGSSPASNSPNKTLACSQTWKDLTDSDTDGLPDAVESLYKTDVLTPDTDKDGFKDGEEVRNGYHPLRPDTVRLDSDSDGLRDDEECVRATDVFAADTDGDGFSDGSEVRNGYDPLVAGDGRGSDRISFGRDTFGGEPTGGGTGSGSGLVFSPPAPPPPASGFSSIFGFPPPASQSTARPSTTRTTQTITQRSSVTTPPPSASPGGSRQQTSTATDIKNYFQALRALRPPENLTAASLTSALQKAFQGQTRELATVRGSMERYERDLRAVSPPQSVVAYHTLRADTIRFVNDRLRTIERSATSAPVQAYAAAQEIRETLPTQLRELHSRYQTLQSAAGGG